MELRVAVIENNDEEAAFLIKQATPILEKQFGNVVFHVFRTSSDYLKSDGKYALFFIDCLLPDGNGTLLAKEIREKNPGAGIIFTTAFLEFAALGYESDALRYLLKPISSEKLQEAVDAFAAKRRQSPVVEITGTARKPDFIPENEIYYIEYVDRKTLVRLKDRFAESTKTIAEFEATLSRERFFRTSRQFLVNMDHITKKTDMLLIMRNGEHVTISKRNLAAFNQAYIHFLKRG